MNDASVVGSLPHKINKSLNGYALFPPVADRCNKASAFAKAVRTDIFREKMSEGGYKIRNQAAIHFITFALVEWVDVFARKDYRDIFLDSIRYYQKRKRSTSA